MYGLPVQLSIRVVVDLHCVLTALLSPSLTDAVGGWGRGLKQDQSVNQQTRLFVGESAELEPLLHYPRY